MVRLGEFARAGRPAANPQDQRWLPAYLGRAATVAIVDRDWLPVSWEHPPRTLARRLVTQLVRPSSVILLGRCEPGVALRD